MHTEDNRPQTDAFDRELAQLLADEEARRQRPDRRPPRGNQPIDAEDVERGREKIERIVGW
jgi:hypothetical protein